RIYDVKSYPPLDLILSRIHGADLLMRANIVLGKETINTFAEFVSAIEYLKKLGVDCVSAWPIRGLDDKVDQKSSPLEEELDRMEQWIKNHDPGYKIRLLREKSDIADQIGQKLTLFPDGTLSNSWCNY
ncbi:MAG: hypothetical protein AABY40_03730, partial [Nanoarchaeota archaeon]